MGIYDDVANIKKIKELSGVEKVFYIGYSQGAQQMMYALAHEEEELSKHLHKYVAFALCTVDEADEPESYYEEVLYSLPAIGVHDLYGKRQPITQKKVCDHFGEDSEACVYASDDMG